MDRETGRSRGFGFVTYTSSEEASSAIQALDGADLHGRRVRVNFATERPGRQYEDGGGFGARYCGGGVYGDVDGRGYGDGSYSADLENRKFASYNNVPGGGNDESTWNYSNSGYNISPDPENNYRATGNFGINPSDSGNTCLGGDRGMSFGDVHASLDLDEAGTDGRNMKDYDEDGNFARKA